MSRHVIDLSSRSALEPALSGGKGAGLAWLCRQRCQVPAGFVITTCTFRELDLDGGPVVLGKEGPPSPAELARMRDLVMTTPIPSHVQRKIERAYSKLGGPVAVRSSMVGEDSSGASFAGQLDTVLGVVGEAVLLEAVRTCWASLFTWRLAKYTNERESLAVALSEHFSMAVVVQRMIEAIAAGVAFSADPITGQRCVVIEAVHGLGDKLVQGQIKPDRYVVNTRGVLSSNLPLNGSAPVLQEEQILQLAEMVRTVACRAQDPQDLEWAWDGTSFHLLQCRAITSLVGKRIYSNKMVSDMSPGLVKPLVYTTKTMGMASNVFGRMFTELMGPNDVDFSSLVTRIHSRIYTDVTLLGKLFEQIGMPANFFQMISRDERTDFRRPPLTPRTLRAMVRFLRFAWRHSSPADQIRNFLLNRDRTLEQYRQADWSALEPQALLAQFDHLMRMHSETQWFIVIGPMNMMVRKRMLDRFASRWTEDIVPSDLIRGLVGLKALEPNAELAAMALDARTLDVAHQCLLIGGDNQSLRATLSSTEQGHALVSSVDEFLSRYGFLSTNGTDFTGTPWLENPTLIWNSIGRLATSASRSEVEDVRAIREEVRKRARSQLGWMKRQFFDRLLASTITYIDLRERTSFLLSQEAYEMRRIFLALGERLVACGSLAERDDIFYLTYDELRQVVEGTWDAEETQRRVREQKAEMAADAQIELPDTMCGEYVPVHPVAPLDDPEYLVGISGSSGLAQGRACVILDPTAAPASLGKDDILVVPFTDVGWTPLFSGIGGIVAETGGQLSHTSIVAREYGLPAVVNVRQATRLILDGQTITVDGNKGRVYLKHALNSQGG